MSLKVEFSDKSERISASQDFLESVQRRFWQTIEENPHVGFFRRVSLDDDLHESEKILSHFKEKKHFVHVGIGGSHLGPEMLLNVLQPKNKTRLFTFINHVDSEMMGRQLSEIVNIEETLFYVVSKSGGTAETWAALSIILNFLEKRGIREEQLKDYLVFCTDEKNGDLRKLSREWDLKTTTVPAEIGGRFSVLSSVGLVPALFAGIDAKELLKGARLFQGDLRERKKDKKGFEGSSLYQVALHLFSSYKEDHLDQTVLMPYSAHFYSFSLWFVQLWAESLGKNGKGFTPIASQGPVDQHSQLQLFIEGPQNKVLFFLEQECSEKQDFDDFSFKQNFLEKKNELIQLASYEKLKSKKLSMLQKAELEGTKAALKEVKRPYISLLFERRDEKNLGQLILFFETLTALMGEFLEINAFNQPGVESSKKFAFEYLGKDNAY